MFFVLTQEFVLLRNLYVYPQKEKEKERKIFFRGILCSLSNVTNLKKLH